MVRKYSSAIFGLLTLLSSQGRCAASDWLQDSSLNGFISVGATYTDNDAFGFRPAIANNDPVEQEWNVTSRTNGGLQWNGQWSPQFSTTLQVAYEKHAQSRTDTELRIATLNYQIDPAWLVRVGRFSPKNYMLTDTRSVSYGQLWAYAPMEFYGPLETRYMDGIEINYSHPTESGVWKTIFGFGQNKLGLGYDTGSLGMSFRPSIGLVEEFSNDSWTVHGAISFVNIANQFAKPLADSWANFYLVPGVSDVIHQLDTEDTQLWFYSVGVSYHEDDWIVQGEMARLSAESDVIPDYLNGYLSVGKRFGAFTPYVLYSQIYTLSGSSSYTTPLAIVPYLSNSQVSYLNTITSGLLNSQMNQKSIGIGCRWDVTTQLALKLQVDRKFVDEGGASLWWHSESSNRGGVVDVVTLNLDYMF